MKTLQPSLKRGRNIWDDINMPVSEYHDRLTRIRKKMKEHGIDVLLLYGDGLDEYGNSSYISNLMMETVGGTMVVIPTEGEVALIFEGGARLIPFVKSKTWIEELETGPKVSDECIKYLEKKDLIRGTIGFAGLRRLMPFHEWQTFQALNRQCDLVDAEHIIKDIRSRKTGRESDQIRRSARITNHVLDRLVHTPFPFLSEHAIQAEAERCAYLSGAADFRTMFARPQQGRMAFRPPDDESVLAGDSIIIYIGLSFEGYWSEGIRTFTAQSSQLTMMDMEKSDELFEGILAVMKKDLPISDFYQHTLKELEEKGISHLPEIGLGNGIGLGLEEPPYIDDIETMQIKTGMWLALRLALINKDSHDMVGHTVFFGEKGPEIVV